MKAKGAEKIFVLALKLIFGIIILVLCVQSPVGFWQSFVFYGAGIYLLGGVQIVAWIILIVLLWAIWSD